MPQVSEYTGAMTQAGRAIGGRSFVLPRHKIMYASVAKNACTSIKWLLADLAGEDRQRFLRGTGFSSAPADTIHQRDLWQHVRRYDGQYAYQDEKITAANGWFLFGITRNPYDRLFSAWQSKFLNHDPHYARYRGEPFYPSLPTSTSEVINGFGEFVRFLAANPEHPISTLDTHFAAQSALLQPWRVPYTRLYDVGEVPDLLADLDDHLERRDIDHEPLTLTRENSTPMRSSRAIFGEGIGELVAERYAADLDLGPYSLDDLSTTVPDWTPEVFRSIAVTANAYEQIRNLTRELRQARRRNELLEEEAAARRSRPSWPRRALARGKRVVRRGIGR